MPHKLCNLLAGGLDIVHLFLESSLLVGLLDGVSAEGYQDTLSHSLTLPWKE
jgi:hypothetical protein